ncbi:hypothetical protein QR680_016606 [Steinernema hermaphroditum]|uniref:Uncharacterized protein n=1 Tax=Steinernema hermaphroditum TaxID=289476 RepID=A0AA39HBQ7_9BILA|nr:hypothetical protein QR680_016606 [Steinernema hermaphroditum]
MQNAGLLAALLLFAFSVPSESVVCHCRSLFNTCKHSSGNDSLPYSYCEGKHCVLEIPLSMKENRLQYLNSLYFYPFPSCGEEEIEKDECVHLKDYSWRPKKMGYWGMRERICRCKTDLCNVETFPAEWDELNRPTTTTEPPEAMRRRLAEEEEMVRLQRERVKEEARKLKEENKRKEEERFTENLQKVFIPIGLAIFFFTILAIWALRHNHSSCARLTSLERRSGVPRDNVDRPTPRLRAPRYHINRPTPRSNEPTAPSRTLLPPPEVEAVPSAPPQPEEDLPPSYEEVCKNLPYPLP